MASVSGAVLGLRSVSSFHVLQQLEIAPKQRTVSLYTGLKKCLPRSTQCTPLHAQKHVLQQLEIAQKQRTVSLHTGLKKWLPRSTQCTPLHALKSYVFIEDMAGISPNNNCEMFSERLLKLSRLDLRRRIVELLLVVRMNRYNSERTSFGKLTHFAIQHSFLIVFFTVVY